VLWRSFSLGLVLIVACSGPPKPVELSRAESAESAGKDDQALLEYEQATRSCVHQKTRERRRRFCGLAYSGRAFTLERLGRLDDAVAAWLLMAKDLGAYDDERGRALHEAALLRLHQGRDKDAYDLFWKVIVEAPDASAAEDALRVVLRDGRRRNPRQLDGVFGELFLRQADHELGDNLLLARADLAEHELEDNKSALTFYDELARRYPKGPLYDDALWHGARLARAAGDAPGALTRLDKLLATRETAFIIGSYHSEWLDNAQLEVGLIRRDDLKDLPGAERAFEGLGELYGDSLLRDDALWELAVTREQRGDKPGACRAVAAIAKKFAESKHMLEHVPELRARLGCEAAK
jgi:tetratricopeptide (TPR) repeat protein